MNANLSKGQFLHYTNQEFKPGDEVVPPAERGVKSQQFPPLYHGSEHEIAVGDTITPGAKPSQYPEHWGTSKYAWATEHPSEAMLHGRNVYTVEPVAPDLAPDDREPHAHASTAGFRVTGALDNDSIREHVAQYRKGRQ